jgi:hypothetical protein
MVDVIQAQALVKSHLNHVSELQSQPSRRFEATA